MTADVSESSEYECKICVARISDKAAAVEHLKEDHELLEIYSYAATTMIQDQDRDNDAREFHRRLDQIKKEFTK
ncbi:MAG: hypothetical protein QW767_01835 [Thermoprotei archaeon]